MSDGWCQICGNLCCTQASGEARILRKLLEEALKHVKNDPELRSLIKIAIEEGN